VYNLGIPFKAKKERVRNIGYLRLVTIQSYICASRQGTRDRAVVPRH